MTEQALADRAALTRMILQFIGEIGLPVREGPVSATPVLPGMEIRGGVLIYDPQSDFAPGDLLHEAGHLAVCDPLTRDNELFESTPGDEMTAIAWSFAACRHLGLPSRVVFHADGYRGGGDSLADNFDDGLYMGHPLLHTYGMAIDPRWATPEGPPPYPHMLRWIR